LGVSGILKGTNLNKLVLKAIEIYNCHRSPEAAAKLVGIEKDGFSIEFNGAFCLSCGVTDYFEDFIYELKDLNSNFGVEIKEIKQFGLQSYRVHYLIKRNSSDAESDQESLFRDFLQERGISFRDYLASNACTKDIIKFHFRTWLFERKSQKK
jgi:hypothetical protein